MDDVRLLDRGILLACMIDRLCSKVVGAANMTGPYWNKKKRDEKMLGGLSIFYFFVVNAQNDTHDRPFNARCFSCAVALETRLFFKA